MANIPPKKRQSMRFQSNNHPVNIPTIIMQNIMVHADMMADPPTFISFLKLNSRPNAKRRNITPISDQVFILAESTTDGVNVK